MILISIDGAVRRPNKPDCYSAGGAFIKIDFNGNPHYSLHFTNEPNESTSQRGEMQGLITGLRQGRELASPTQNEIYMITDSEFLFNAFTRGWYKKWDNNGYVKADGTLVKNPDMWRIVVEIMQSYALLGISVNMYHIKGHVIPFGAKVAQGLMNADPTGEILYKEVGKKLDAEWSQRINAINNARDLFERNHRHSVPLEIFKEMVICNMVVDLATSNYISGLQ